MLTNAKPFATFEARQTGVSCNAVASSTSAARDALAEMRRWLRVVTKYVRYLSLPSTRCVVNGRHFPENVQTACIAELRSHPSASVFSASASESSIVINNSIKAAISSLHLQIPACIDRLQRRNRSEIQNLDAHELQGVRESRSFDGRTLWGAEADGRRGAVQQSDVRGNSVSLRALPQRSQTTWQDGSTAGTEPTLVSRNMS